MTDTAPASIAIDNSAWFGTVGAAEYLGLKPMTLHNYRHHLTGPECTRRGARCYYSREALDAWNDERLAKLNKRKTNAAARDAKKAAANERARNTKAKLRAVAAQDAAA